MFPQGISSDYGYDALCAVHKVARGGGEEEEVRGWGGGVEGGANR